MLLGQQRQHGLFLADHAADEGVDRHQQTELGEVGPQPKSRLWSVVLTRRSPDGRR